MFLQDADLARRCRFRNSRQIRASDLDPTYVWIPKLFRMSALRAGAAMKTKRGIDTVAKLASEGGAREVETSLERLRPTSCLTGNAEKQKSVCGKACQRQRQHGRVHFMESVKRSVPILK